MPTTLPDGISPPSSTRVAWFLTSVQFAYVIWLGVCVWVALARAAHFAGHLYIPYQGDPYTASADIWTGWSSGFKAPMMMTALLQPFIAIVAILWSVWLLAQTRVRNNMILFSALLISVLLVLVTFVLAMVPAGRSISNWILD